MKKFLKVIGWIVAGFVSLIIVLAIIGSMTNDSKTTSTDSNTESASTKETKKEVPKKEKKTSPKQFTIGQDVKVGKLVYKATGVKETNELKSILGDKTTSGKYVIVDLTILNKDKKARYADTNMFKIKTADGTEYSASAELDMYVNESGTGFFLEDINPNISKSGKVVFELPSEAKQYNLEVSSGFGWSGGETETIKLK